MSCDLQYFGRVLPERVDLTAPPLEFGIAVSHSGVRARISTIRSRIFVRVSGDDGQLDFGTLRNVVFSLMSSTVDVAGFLRHAGLQVELEGVTDLNSNETELFGWDGHAFDENNIGSALLFRPSPPGSVEIPVSVYDDRYFLRAVHELRQAIRYPDYTALHCRLALESIRNAYDNEDEKRGWVELQGDLGVSAETIKFLKPASDLQRHGRNLWQDWNGRRAHLRVSWEIVYRYYRRKHGEMPSSAFTYFEHA